MANKSSGHLLAPELASALELFPKIDFARGVAPFRGELFGSEKSPLTAAQQAVGLEKRMVSVPGAPDVPVLVYTPPGKAAAPRPAVLDIHGGGFVLGDAAMSDAANRTTVLEMGCVVVSVDYRLAPETPWPGPIDDCYAALCWMHAQAGDLAIDPARIAVSGGSAGGGHAAALAIRARAEGGPALCFQLLDFPMLDDRTCAHPEPHPYCGEFGWTEEMNHFGWKSLLGMEPGGPDVPTAAVPARTADLSGLPPAFILVGALDLFMEEDIEYARRLARAGVPVELHVIPGAYHGFGLAQDAPQSKQAALIRRQALARALGVASA